MTFVHWLNTLINGMRLVLEWIEEKRNFF